MARNKYPLQTPLIEGDRATFFWRGSPPPQLLGDFSGWEPEEAISLRKAGRDLWKHTVQLPPGAYIEYAFVFGHERVYDPANPRQVPNGLGDYNHYFYMPGGSPTPFVRRRREVLQGILTSQMIYGGDNVVGAERRVYFYQPASHEPCPLLVVFDGPDYLRQAKLARIVDNLLADGRIQPFAMAMVANSKQARTIEYACNDATLDFLLEAVLPAAGENLNLLDINTYPGAFGVLGASMGGLMALYSGLRLPHIFGRVLSQSGAFMPEWVIGDLVRLSDVKPLKIWMDVGLLESLYAVNQEMYALLLEKGYAVTYRDYPGGHNYSAWRDDVWRGLEVLFH